MEDWEHDLRAGLLGVRPVQVPKHLATVRDHGGNRASGMQTGFTPELTRDFFHAHRAVWMRMKELGRTDWSYLETFSRKLFWIARMCGERGLIEEAGKALDFAEEMMAGRGAAKRARGGGTGRDDLGGRGREPGRRFPVRGESGCRGRSGVIHIDSPDGDYAVATRGLSKRYGQATALESVDLRVPEGAVYVLVGINGAGETEFGGQRSDPTSG